MKVFLISKKSLVYFAYQEHFSKQHVFFRVVNNECVIDMQIVVSKICISITTFQISKFKIELSINQSYTLYHEMSIRREFYNRYQKIEFGRILCGKYQKLRLAAKESNIDDIVKYWQCCKAIAKQSRLRYLFEQLHEWCFKISRTNKELFLKANKIMKESK